MANKINGMVAPDRHWYQGECQSSPGQLYERGLEQGHPTIKWDEPQNINGRFGCRYCVTMFGLRGRDVSRLPATYEEAREMIRRTHLPVDPV